MISQCTFQLYEIISQCTFPLYEIISQCTLICIYPLCNAQPVGAHSTRYAVTIIATHSKFYKEHYVKAANNKVLIILFLLCVLSFHQHARPDVTVMADWV